MLTCTFFGNKNTPIEVLPYLRRIIIDLIENENVNYFYVGNHGAFDYMVRDVLKELKLKYQNINYRVVLAYLENKNDGYIDYSDTIYPDGLESTPLKYAIIKRNNWMISKSNYVVTYIKNKYGNAIMYKELAIKKGKIVIEILDYIQ